MIRSIKSYFTLAFHHRAFRDVVSGKMVNVYIDCFGDYWMKSSRWALFRVAKHGARGAKLINKRFKWVVVHGNRATYLVQQPKCVPGGFITRQGQRFVGRDVILVSRTHYDRYGSQGLW